ncbi:MAG: DUF6568 family protein [Bacilli bacterium]
MKKKEERKTIPFKNYIYLIVIAAVVVILTMYINIWIKSYKQNKTDNSVLTGNISEVNINELSETLSETNQVVLYVGYKNKNIYNMEKKLLKSINDNEIRDYVVYLDVSDNLGNDKYVNILKKNFKSKENEIKKAPMFIYIKNGEALEVINSTNSIVDVNDFNKLIKKYEIGE